MTSPLLTDDLETRRREVEDLVCGLPETRDGDHGFNEPWEIRAFALAVGAHGAGQYEWSQFQAALVESIQKWESEEHSGDQATWSYYEHWVVALEQVLSESGELEPETVDARTAQVLDTPANRGHHRAHLDPIAVDPGTVR